MGKFRCNKCGNPHKTVVYESDNAGEIILNSDYMEGVIDLYTKHRQQQHHPVILALRNLLWKGGKKNR